MHLATTPRHDRHAVRAVQLCCLTTRWRITDQVIDHRSGCCGSREDSLYVKRMRDIAYDGNCLKRCCCCGRATIVIYSSDRTHPELRLTTFGARGIYRALRDAWQGGIDRQQIDVMTD